MPSRSPDNLPPDAVVEFYKKNLDVTAIRENLKRTPEERIRRLMELQRAAEELEQSGEQDNGVDIL